MNRQYWAYLIGAWAILPEWLALHRGQIEALVDGSMLKHADDQLIGKTLTIDDLIIRGANGTATINIHGPMIKRAGFFASLFGFTGTDTIRQMVDHAAKDDDISSIMLHVESPGGHVAGVHELADAIRKANAIKPVAAHIEDIGASAAYWAASQARRITASPTAEVGSLGTLAVVPDLSAMAERQGVKIHVVSTGAYKGMGVPGTVIEDDHLKEVQRRVDDVNRFFMRAVQRGRGLKTEELYQVNDGRVWIAGKAQELGLIDKVSSYEAAMRDVAGQSASSRRDELKDSIQRRRALLETEPKEEATHAAESR